jgi:carbon monoxide dehydrogenase subunit G
MKLEQSFEVAAPLEHVWEALIDVERVAPCLPGASVTGRNADGSFTGEFKVKIGPTAASYSGTLTMEHVDGDAHTATMEAAGTDRRGQGGARATIVTSLVDAGGGRTAVSVDTDYQITGRLARFGRGGMIEEISKRLLGEFSKNLQAMVAGGEEAQATAAPEPVSAPEPTPAPADEVPVGDPDAAIEGAMPVAGSLAEEPATPDPAPEEPATPDPTPENEPISAFGLVRTVAWGRAKSNPAPLVALVAGFLVALRVLRRRD